MTPEEHYKAAEEIIDKVNEQARALNRNITATPEDITASSVVMQTCLMAAQVHATLATLAR